MARGEVVSAGVLEVMAVEVTDVVLCGGVAQDATTASRIQDASANPRGMEAPGCRRSAAAEASGMSENQNHAEDDLRYQADPIGLRGRLVQEDGNQADEGDGEICDPAGLERRGIQTKQ